MFTIFKKGDRDNPDNYRGISVTDSVAKLYDMVICERLCQWFRPCREQAGAQQKRECLEHIATLRLIIDSTKKKRNNLFVVFIDFSKAYDVMPRHTLFRTLKRLGCGVVMLAAIIAMYEYRVTESIVGCAVVTSTVEVRQGLSTSCLLFVNYVDELIKMMKTRCERETFIDWLHILLFMDDTVLLSTSRSNILRKLRILKEFCDEYGMRINAEKTKFFVISGGPGDAEPLRVDGLVVQHCTSYTYLGSPFTCDGSVSSSVKVHAQNKLCHVLKFVSFIRKNNDIPFIVKRRLFDAALMSALLYGCESWVCADVKPVAKLYNWAIKELLGVRKTTANLVCYAELGYPSLPDLVRYRQHKFYHNMWLERYELIDDPLSFAIRTAISLNTPAGKLVSRMTRENVPHMSTLLRNVHNAIADSNTSRCTTYRTINPHYVTHSVYSERHTVNDRLRISFTRFRVSGHSLAIETGRWNRRGRGRLPVEERLCECGDVQSEQHVLETCPRTQRIRDMYGFTTLHQVFSNFTNSVTCRIIHDILSTYQ